MWRIQGLVCRVLSRYHANAPLRITQGHHRVEDDVRGGSTVLSTGLLPSDSSSQTGGNGERQRRKRTSQFCYSVLLRYTALDAVGWVCPVLTMQRFLEAMHRGIEVWQPLLASLDPGLEIATLLVAYAPEIESVRPLNIIGSICATANNCFGAPAHTSCHPCISQYPTGATPIKNVWTRPCSPGLHREANLLRSCTYRLMLEILCQQHVLPRGIPVNCLGSVKAIQDSSSGNIVGHTHSTEDSTPSHIENESLSCDSAQSGESLSSSECDPKDTSPSQTPKDKAKNPPCPEDEELTGAANNLKQTADSSVPVILNIIGIENAKSGDYQAAFSCFLASAQHGYSKAQFNVGVCYEKGRGVRRDKDKAAQFYRQAATGGHSQAMYRYAKYLLHSRGQQSAEDTHTAIGLMESAAASGVREAQAYLGVLYSQEPLRDEHKAVGYLRMAAENGDSASQLYLGQCYEWGFGVQQCFRTAVDLYQQAAKAGNQQALSLLSALYSTGSRGPVDTALRSIRSAPCFSVGNALQLRLRPSLSNLESGPPFQPLPHSWSTGSFLAQSLPSSSGILAEGERIGGSPLLPNSPPCRWTIGFG